MIGKKKGQEEMVGFVLIVVIVAVVFVVLLAIFLRSPKTESQNQEVNQFLGSMMGYTTDCALGYEPNYLTLGEVMAGCYAGKNCLNGNNTCDELNRTVSEIIKKSYGMGPTAYYNGYRFEANFNGTQERKNILSLAEGNCSYYKGADYFFSQSGGSIEVVVKLCTKT